MRFLWLMAWAFVLTACDFDPDLEGQGYLRCWRPVDCDEACTCSQQGYCLPPVGALPDVCEPGMASVEQPWRLMGLDWSDPDTTHELFVDAPGDAPFEPVEQDYWSAREQALADDGALSLREALVLAGLSEKPVRIRFAQGLFPADGSGPPIELTGAVELNADQVLLDGRGTGEVITYAGDPGRVPLNLLSVTGRVVVMTGLRIEGHEERAIRVVDAEGIYVTGSVLDGNRVGMWIQRARGVTLDDGALALGAPEARPNTFEYNNTGLVVLQSERVRVMGTEVIGSWEEGVRFMQGCSDVSIGPAAGEDGVDWSRVTIADNFTGLNVFGFDGQAGVRGAVLVGNEVDVAIQASQGVLAFVNVTVADAAGTVIEHHDQAGGLLLVLRNLIVQGTDAQLKHLHCYGGGDTLTVSADRLLFSSPVIIECAALVGGFGQDAMILEDEDPGFVAPDEGDYHLAAGSPAIDVGASLDHEGVALDFNGSGEGMFCGAAPDLGAFERCP